MKRLVLLLSCTLLIFAIIWKVQLHSGQEIEFEQFQELPHDLQKKIFLEAIYEEATVDDVISTVDSLLLTNKAFNELIQSGDRLFTNSILEHCVNLFLLWQQNYLAESLKVYVADHKKIIAIHQDFVSDKNKFMKQIENLSKLLQIPFYEKTVDDKNFLEVLPERLHEYPFFADFYYFDLMLSNLVSYVQRTGIVNFDLATMQLLQKYGANITMSLPLDITPLMIAILTQQIDLVEYLIEQGLNVSQEDWMGNTALNYAVNTNFLEAVKLLLDYGIDINHQDNFGNSVLFGAIDQEQGDVVSMLLDAEADINIANNLGMTPLMLVALRGNVPLTRLFLAKKADVLATTNEGQTALGYAHLMDNDELIFILEAAELRARK